MTSVGERILASGPKRMLALDGGGVRGALTTGFLARIEEILGERTGRHEDFRLCDYYDLIGGTSTGAILATLLAMGRSAREVRTLYVNLAPHVFRRAPWRIFGLFPKFDGMRLLERIRAEVGELTLDSPDLRTGLAIVMKRLDTGSPWVVTNNPYGKFYNDPTDGSFIGNRHYPLASLIRASTAAPSYFKAEAMRIVDGEEAGLFVDGGVSPHNSPSLLLFMMARMKGHGFGWRLGADNLLLTSIGTGSFRTRLSAKSVRKMLTIGFAARSLSGLINDGEVQALLLLQWLSDSDTSWTINDEIGDLEGERLVDDPLLTFHRYDARLDQGWLATELNESFDEKRLSRLQAMDDPAMIPELVRIGELAAERQVHSGHFPAVFDVISNGPS